MKKIVGYILVVVGGFIGLSLVMQLPEIIEDLIPKTAPKSATEAAYSEGYIVGIFIGGIILFVVTIAMLWFGLKLIKDTELEKIEDS